MPVVIISYSFDILLVSFLRYYILMSLILLTTARVLHSDVNIRYYSTLQMFSLLLTHRNNFRVLAYNYRSVTHTHTHTHTKTWVTMRLSHCISIVVVFEMKWAEEKRETVFNKLMRTSVTRLHIVCMHAK
jgi:hypothetical protein